MEIDDPRIRIPLNKIIDSIQKDRTLLCRAPKSKMSSLSITAENLSDLAGNHLFDDAPELFGITKEDGVIVRKYLSGSGFETFTFVSELHQAYPNVIENESSEYLKKVKRRRQEQGLGELLL